jgi:hypothetical protein
MRNEFEPQRHRERREKKWNPKPYSKSKEFPFLFTNPYIFGAFEFAPGLNIQVSNF